jgi:hypothetical protein
MLDGVSAPGMMRYTANAVKRCARMHRAELRTGLPRSVRHQLTGECAMGRCIPTHYAEQRERTEDQQNLCMLESAQPAADFCRRRRNTVISFSA